MLGLRWTLGAVSPRGFAALRLSLWGAWKVFGSHAAYAVLVNTVPVERARALVGEVPAAVRWVRADHRLPTWLRERFLDAKMAEGVAWKFAPIRWFAGREIAFDNDVVLWRMPDALARWLDEGHPERCLLAEDVALGFGQFTDLVFDLVFEQAGFGPRNLGVRGIPPNFDLDAALLEVLTLRNVRLHSELDEQGLQVAALSKAMPPRVIAADDVTICSPFPPHVPQLGRSGAHFVGINAERLGWEYYGEPAEQVRARHFDAHVEEVARRVGVRS